MTNTQHAQALVGHLEVKCKAAQHRYDRANDELKFQQEKAVEAEQMVKVRREQLEEVEEALKSLAFALDVAGIRIHLKDDGGEV